MNTGKRRGAKNLLLVGVWVAAGCIVLVTFLPLRPTIEDPDQLVRASRELMLRAEEYPFGLIPAGEYPAEIQRLKPFAVWVESDRLRILPRISPRERWRKWGGYIVFFDKEVALREGAGDFAPSWVPTGHPAIYRYEDDL